MHPAPLGALVTLLVLLASRPAEARAPVLLQTDGPRLVLETLDGERRVQPARGVSIADLRELEGAVLVRFAGFPTPAAGAVEPAAEARVELLGGGRLVGRVEGGAAETLVLELAGGPLLRVPIDALAAMRFPARIPAAERERVEGPAEGDRLYRRQGAGLDRLDGTLVELAGEGVRFQSVLGTTLVPWPEVAALFVEDLGFGREDDEADERVPVVVDLVGGSRVLGRLVELGADGVRLRASFGQDLRLAPGLVHEVVVADGRLAFLSDLPVAEALEGSAFGDDLGMSWPHRRDRSVSGEPLRAGGRTWARGLGVHAPSRLVWELDGSWRALRGLVAIDDEVRRLKGGSVVFRVEVDGERAWESGVVRAGETPVEIPPIALEGAKSLALVVDMASDFYVGDRADWLRVRLVR